MMGYTDDEDFVSLLAVRYPEPEPDPDVLPDLADVSTMAAPSHLDKWYVQDLIRAGKIILVAASEGLGKSFVRKELEIRLATGTGALFGHYYVNGTCRVGTIDEENGPDEEWRRDEDMLAALEVCRADLGGRYRRASFLGLNLCDKRAQDYIRSQATNLDVLFLDTGGAMVDEEYGPPLKGAVRFLKSLLREYPTLTVVVLVHMVKPPRGDGNTSTRRALTDVMGQWTRQADVVAVMTDLGECRYRWELMKRRGVPKSAGVVDYSSGLTSWVADVDAPEVSIKDEDRVLRAISAGAATYKDVMVGTGMGRDRVFSVVRKLRHGGFLTTKGDYALTASGMEALS